MKKKMAKSSVKRQNLLELGVILIIIILIGILSSFLHTRIDLTTEKRHTLTNASKDLLKDVDDAIYIKVYLEGELPASFKRLRNATKELLDEFRAHNKLLQYDFIDLSEITDEKQRQEIYGELVSKGLEPTNLQTKTNEGTSTKLIFPAALVSYGGKELPVQLLGKQIGLAAEAQLNNSIQNLEYGFANAIDKLSTKEQPKIAFIQGHGELEGLEIADITTTLNESYQVEQVVLDGKLNSLASRSVEDSTAPFTNKYKAIIIAKPDSVFSEQDKYLIDQFIMRGGRVLWLVEPVFASLDSLQSQSTTLGLTQDLNLGDLFFKYGVRLNSTLVKDVNAVPIPMNTQPAGVEPKFDFYVWPYAPILMPTTNHPLVKNLNAIKSEFISTLDTIAVAGVKKEFLLRSSKYSNEINAPVVISLEQMFKKADERDYPKSYLPVAVLLEGKFPSAYKNRIAPEIINNKVFDFQEKSESTSMIIITDGDIIKNQVSMRAGVPSPLRLGFDKYTNETFGNKEFLLNAINYLCDDRGLLTVRSRELKIRLLDKTKIDQQRVLWQMINVLGPILLIIILGLIYITIRKKKFS